MLDADEDRLNYKNDFALERYEERIPELERRAKVFGRLAVWEAAMAALSGATWLLGGHGTVSVILFGAGVATSWISAIARRNNLAQVDTIKKGGRPEGVSRRLIRERGLPRAGSEVKGFADSIAEIRQQAERAAENEASQWWRKDGSVWSETQKFINSTNEVFAAQYRLDLAREKAEAQARADRLLEDILATQAQLELAERAAETERRRVATEKWLAQTRKEEKEWDAFVEDAQMDARARKERGEFYEPPPGVPGSLYAAGPNPDPMDLLFGPIGIRQRRASKAILSDRNMVWE
jgi:hypothetical protein